MRHWTILIGALAVASPIASVTAQTPPVPTDQRQLDLAVKLVEAFRAKNLEAYAALLADEVKVSEDGTEIASSKEAWLKRFGPKLIAEGVSFDLRPGFSSSGRLLFIEYFNSLGSWGRTPPPDCCWSYDAVAYDVRDGKITRIQRLAGGHRPLDRSGKPVEPGSSSQP